MFFGNDKLSERLPWLLTFSALFAVAIGVTNGDQNHVVYLLPGLHRADPEFLRSDWFVTQVDHPHHIFTRIVEWIARSGHLEVGLGLASVAQSVGAAMALWLLARALYEEPLRPWIMTVMVLAATGTRAIGFTRLVMPQFEAATIAGVATLTGLALLAAQRPLVWVGTAWGVAAMIHSHFAVLLVPVVGATCLIVARTAGPTRAVPLLLPVLVMGLPNYLQVLSYGSDPARELAAVISLSRFPQHYDPRTWGPLPGLVYGVLLVAGALAYRWRAPRRRNLFLVALLTMIGVTVVSLLVGYFGLSRDVMLVFPWRLSIVVMPIAILFISAAVVEPPAWFGRVPRFVAGSGALVSLAILAASVTVGAPRRVAFAVAAVVVAAYWMGWIVPGHHAGNGSRNDGGGRRWQQRVLVAILLVGFLPAVANGWRRSALEIRTSEETRRPLYEWIRSQTADTSTFAIPPDWADFRLVARRAIIADYKAPPASPGEMVGWAERIRLSTGALPGASGSRLDSAFLAADCARIDSVRAAYAPRYTIRSTGAPPCGHIVYSDSNFTVVEARSAVSD